MLISKIGENSPFNVNRNSPHQIPQYFDKVQNSFNILFQITLTFVKHLVKHEFLSIHTHAKLCLLVSESTCKFNGKSGRNASQTVQEKIKYLQVFPRYKISDNLPTTKLFS